MSGTASPVAAVPRPESRNPIRLLASSWPWRSLAYLLTGGPIALAWLVASVVWVTVGIVGSLVLVGLPVLLTAPLAGLPLAEIERRRLRLMRHPQMPTPHRQPEVPGPWRWLRTRLSDQVTWRELAFGLLFVVLAVIDIIVAATAVGLVVFPLAAPLLRWLVQRGTVDWDMPNLSTPTRPSSSPPPSWVSLRC